MAKPASAAERPLKIAGTSFAPGQSGSVDVPVGYLINHEKITMPVTVHRGRKPGPRLCVCAAVHGDEINGVESIRRLIRMQLLEKLRGDLIAVPVVNVPAFLARSRYLPDRRDLNRLFPGSTTGSLGARLAHSFVTEIVRKSTHLIDLHTGAVNRANLPQLRISPGRQENLEMAQAFDAPVIIKAPTRPGSLRAYLKRRKISTIMFEGGEALRLDPASVRFALRGVLQVMRHLEMLPAEKGKEAPKKKPSVISSNTYWERAPRGGVFTPLIPLGRAVSKGAVLGSVNDPFGNRVTEISCQADGVVIGRTNEAIADEGDAVFHIATTSDPSKAEKTIRRSEVDLGDDIGHTETEEPLRE